MRNCDVPSSPLQSAVKLTSAQNPKVKFTCKLRDRKQRDRHSLTLLEGFRELSRGHEFGMKIKEVFFCPSLFLGENEMPLIERLRAAGADIYEVTSAILTKMTYRDRPEGLVAVAETKRHTLDAIPVRKNGLYLIAESIEKPGNLGSILRSADATGVDGVILCDKRTDIYNPNVIRSSTGALFTVPLAETERDQALKWAKDNEIELVAATPHTETFHTNVDLSAGVAILVGAEQYGLSDFWLEQADILVKIPMLGKIDSLNVATATTILLYEAVRQRQGFVG